MDIVFFIIIVVIGVVRFFLLLRLILFIYLVRSFREFFLGFCLVVFIYGMELGRMFLESGELIDNVSFSGLEDGFILERFLVFEIRVYMENKGVKLFV